MIVPLGDENSMSCSSSLVETRAIDKEQWNCSLYEVPLYFQSPKHTKWSSKMCQNSSNKICQKSRCIINCTKKLILGVVYNLRWQVFSLLWPPTNRKLTFVMELLYSLITENLHAVNISHKYRLPTYNLVLSTYVVCEGLLIKF